MSLSPVQERFVAFVKAREEARHLKMVDELSPDPIIAQFKFCNVNREHDAVTRWIDAHVRPRLDGYALVDQVAQLYICRILNEPAVLREVFPVTDVARAKAKLRAIKARGDKILRGVYLCVPHGTSNVGVPVEDYFLDIYRRLARLDYGRPKLLASVADTMRTVDGVGDFIANQVCTDLRYQPCHGGVDGRWRDWLSFVLAGPGTRRGLNRYQGATGVETRRFPKLAGDCAPLLLQIREDLQHEFCNEIQYHFLDINNLSNCFCEFDKYERVRAQHINNERITCKRYGIQN